MLASTKEETMGKKVVSQSNGTSKNDAMTTSPSSAATTKEKEIATEKKPMTAKETTKAETAKTQAQSTFYVIGISQTVAYEDTKALEKAVENLWTKCYNEDFSAQLVNITDSENMYVTYSNYDQPKGKMNITIGYKVKNLSDLPKSLKGVKVPNNDYYTYDLSGSASDYEGEEWGQLGELMAYRKATSVDFEVYQFDNNYEVKAAKMWIAAK